MGGSNTGRFRDVPEFFRAGDLLVLNNSRVIPARLRGRNARSGGQFEILLLEENACNDWWAMLRPAKRARVGTQIVLHDTNGNAAEHPAPWFSKRTRKAIGGCNFPVRRTSSANLNGSVKFPCRLTSHGRTPAKCAKTGNVTKPSLPKLTVRSPHPRRDYTSRAELLQQIRDRGVQVCFVTLHVGAGTFLPVKAEVLAAHRMHEERFTLDEETACAVNEAKAAGRRVIAVGTTTVRVLESVAAQNGGKLVKNAGKTGIFIHPPFRFQIVDGLLTNFHLPRSTLLMLVSAFAAPGETRGREMILSAYAEAIRERYRFYSYGDAMLIL